MRTRYLGRVGALVAAVFTATAAPAQSPKFTDMNRQVEGFLTGLWAKTTSPADRPPNEAEVTAGLAHCDESMIDPKSEEKGVRAVFPSNNASRGDVSMFRSDDAFVLVERMQRPDGTQYPFLRKMNVRAVEQNRIIVRFVSRAMWSDGAWADQPGTPRIWGDAFLGDLDVGGATEHIMLLARDNAQVTYVKCGS